MGPCVVDPDGRWDLQGRVGTGTAGQRAGNEMTGWQTFPNTCARMGEGQKVRCGLELPHTKAPEALEIQTQLLDPEAVRQGCLPET